MLRCVRSLALMFLLTAASLEAQNVCTRETETAATNVVTQLLAENLVRFTYDGVYIDPTLWQLLDAEQKEQTTRLLAVYKNCIWNERNRLSQLDSFKIDVFDKQSGQKIASIGIFRGFRVHPPFML